MCNSYKQLDIVKVIKSSRIPYLGYLFKSKDNNLTKLLSFNKPWEKRKPGKFEISC